MWMVWDSEEGIVCTGGYDFCLLHYDDMKSNVESWLKEENELGEEDLGYQVVLAKIGQVYALVETPKGFEGKETKEEIK